MTAPFDVFMSVLRRPEAAGGLSLAQWDDVIRIARSTNLLASVQARLEAHGLMDAVPERPRLHLESARTVAQKHVRDVLWEIRRIGVALRPLGLPVFLLKGAAYVAADLPAARGRLFGDIDFMVPKERIREVEAALQREGWLSPIVDSHDEKYYREWSHQIPPMFHGGRNTIIDVHFSIIPDVARDHVSVRKLYAAARPVPGLADVVVLSRSDMVLHSATHLFNEGEFDHGLRDVVDLDALLRDFGRDPAFWTELADRAEELGLTRPLYHAIRNAVRLMGTPAQGSVVERVRRWRRPGAWGGLLDYLFDHGLRPEHELCVRPMDVISRWMLYVRGHYIRMPFHMLIPHLARKAVVKRFPRLVRQPRF